MTRRSVPTAVPEGGWGWVVCLASCWTNGVVFGIINSFGVLYVVMLKLDGADAFKTSWIGAVCAGLTFFMSPFASVITDKLGCRPAGVIGGALALAGVLASSFATRIEHMYVTYGFAMGLGFAIAYQPSLYILGIYFQKRLGIANGLVTFGSAIFTIVLPIAMREVLDRYGLGPCLWLQSSIIFVMLLGGLTYRPRPEAVQRLDLKEDYTPVARGEDGAETDLRDGSGGCCGKLRRRRSSTTKKCSNPCSGVIDTSIWKERNYRIWAIGVPLGMFGYFVPFFHLVKHVNDTLPNARAEVLIMCLGATSGLGRLVSGVLSDHPKINPIYIQQVAFLIIGVSTTLMPVVRNFIALCALVLVMGIFDGAFVSMMGPIAFNLVGPARASQAIGCILGLMSMPMMIGPPIAGIIYDVMNSYDIAFICSGVPPIVAACILFLIRPSQRENVNQDENDCEKEDTRDDAEMHALMVPREITPAMAAKEAQTNGSASNEKGSGSNGMEKGGLRGGRVEDRGRDLRGDEVSALQDGHGRRRSYRRDRMGSEIDARIIMQTDLPHDISIKPHHRRANGVHPAENNNITNGEIGGKGAYGHEGSASPYAQRNRNHSNHLNDHGSQTGKTQVYEMNGFIHSSDARPDEGLTALHIRYSQETTV
ncbi:monocarboxylate transporter 10-like [Diadema antillarum]|uniref:monocarboxylate transporter 10-like n=1 Tax=Diadema antillarum TaxID=105358 RepID=UPI003A84F88F